MLSHVVPSALKKPTVIRWLTAVPTPPAKDVSAAGLMKCSYSPEREELDQNPRTLILLSLIHI